MNDLSLKMQMPATDKIDLQVKQAIDSEPKHLPVRISSKALHYSSLERFFLTVPHGINCVVVTFNGNMFAGKRPTDTVRGCNVSLMQKMWKIQNVTAGSGDGRARSQTELASKCSQSSL